MKKLTYLMIAAVTAGIGGACGGKNTSSNVATPGAPKTTKDNILNAGADLMQVKTPLRKFNVYLDGFHFYNGNINAQIMAFVLFPRASLWPDLSSEPVAPLAPEL